MNGENFRAPPHSVEAEQAVIGGLMLDNGAWARVEDALTPADFYRHDHKLIYEAIATLADRGEPFDMVTLHEQLAATGNSMDAGGLAYLGELASNTPSAANIDAYARIVSDRAVRRRLLAATAAVEAAAHDPGKGIDELVADAEARLADVSGAIRARGNVGIREALGLVVSGIEERYESMSPIIGLPTGYQDLDELTAGFQASDLIIVAGRPSMGKTALTSCIAEYVALRTEAPVLICTMEMPVEPLALRMISSMGRIDLQRLRNGRMNEDDWPKLTSAVSMLADMPLHFNAHARSVAEVRAAARRIPGLRLLVIDYLGLMYGEGETQTLRIGAIVAGVKNIARDLNIPVILVAQLNRSLENRPNKRPMLADLRDSGEIEQHADLVLFLYRDEVYNPDSADKGVAELIVAKQRNGPTDTVRLTWSGMFARFENHHPNVYSNEPGVAL